MEAQYRQFAKNGGKYILQQIASKNQEAKYQIDRQMFVAALFYQEFIKQFIETQEKRTRISELVNTILTTLPDTMITKAANDPGEQKTLLELQLWRDKELVNNEEDKKYQSVKQIIMPVLQEYIKRITKNTSISSETKQHILNLAKKI